MTTLKQILNEKASGNDTKYRQQIHFAWVFAEKLDEVEKELLRRGKDFSSAAQVVTELTGLHLRLADPSGARCFWFDGKRNSVTYSTRAAALQALIDNKIEWA